MNKICLNKGLCPQNHHCPAVRICPVNAISQASPYSAPIIDNEKCILCGKCINMCPTSALYLKLNKQ